MMIEHLGEEHFHGEGSGKAFPACGRNGGTVFAIPQHGSTHANFFLFFFPTCKFQRGKRFPKRPKLVYSRGRKGGVTGTLRYEARGLITQSSVTTERVRESLYFKLNGKPLEHSHPLEDQSSSTQSPIYL